MKKINYFLFVIVAYIFLAIPSCKKEQSLPPLSSEGKNTFGCRINGVPWIPQGYSDFSTGIVYPTSGGYYAQFNSPLVHIWIKTNDRGGNIDLYIRNYDSQNYLKPGMYLCNKSTTSLPFGSGSHHTYGTYWYDNKEYITDSIHTGWIELLKSDSINGIVSGRFEFNAYNSADGKAYKITEGRFDYKNH
jgi:hypothetical protein